jgi:hypothetical protein
MFAGGHEDVLGELREHKQVLLAFELPIQNLHLLFQGAQEEEVSSLQKQQGREDAGQPAVAVLERVNGQEVNATEKLPAAGLTPPGEDRCCRAGSLDRRGIWYPAEGGEWSGGAGAPKVNANWIGKSGCH